MKPKNGLLITFEGIEGSGKSTQLARLADDLTRLGYKVTTTREPGGTAFGEQIRRVLLSNQFRHLDPRTELFLYLASRTQHLEEVVLPALREGRVVLCDRFSDATVAYQGYGRGLDLSFVQRAVAFAAKGVRADLTLLLDLDANRGLSRVHGRSTSGGMINRLDEEALEFHQRVRDGYLELAQAEPGRIKIIDANPGIASVANSIRKIVAGFLTSRESRKTAPVGNRRRIKGKRTKRC
jgi:dTMP kinase